MTTTEIDPIVASLLELWKETGFPGPLYDRMEELGWPIVWNKVHFMYIVGYEKDMGHAAFASETEWNFPRYFPVL